MKIANDMSNEELEESIRELGTNTTKCLPNVPDEPKEERHETMFYGESDKNEIEASITTPITSPVATMLSKYYSQTELANIQSAITPEKAAALHSSMLNISTGAYSSIPRLCHGQSCKSAHACPFVKNRVETNFIGNKCPIEIMLVDEWRGQYLELMKQNEIDADNIVVHNYINELIECEIINMRMNH